MTYEELTKDFATDDELSQIVKEFAVNCRDKNFAGIMCVTSPKSEISWTGISCDLYTSLFLIKSLIQRMADAAHVPATKLATVTAWYLAQVDSGALNEDTRTYKTALTNKAKQLARKTLAEVMQTNSGTLDKRFPTLNNRIHVD